VRGVRNTTEGIAVVDTSDDATSGVRVTVVASGICGSDVHLTAFGPTAVTLGHECAGRLDDGTPVAVHPWVACGTCRQCREGQPQQCDHLFSTMYGITRNGGLADEIWVEPACARPLPPSLPLADACLVEPLAVALHGVHRAGIASGMRVLVLGAGPIGLCAVVAARATGAQVDLEAHRPARQVAGERLGAHLRAVGEYDVVVEAAGSQGALDTAVAQARRGGTVVLVGSYWDPVALGLAVQMREVTLVPAFTYGHHHGRPEFDAAADLLTTTPELAAAAITDRLPLDEARRAFALASDRAGDTIKVVLEP
jgi:threonine dehydrogenase-like Zn-dependent dehydrogenase